MRKQIALAVLLFWLAIGCSTTITTNSFRSPTNTLQDVIDRELGKTNDPTYRGPRPTKIVFSDQRGDYAFAITEDGNQWGVGQVWFVQLGTEWSVEQAMVFEIQDKSLTVSNLSLGGNLAKEKSKSTPLDKNVKDEWIKKWAEYRKSKGYLLKGASN